MNKIRSYKFCGNYRLVPKRILSQALSSIFNNKSPVLRKLQPYAVVCSTLVKGCGSMGPIYKIPMQAINSWNKSFYKNTTF